ncbi:CDP-alcohol phosphatidyltransferase [Ammoniphilus oxalaticus]|uniref:CDP-alcohol phosphatidyltransferase n=1 Tax=Ammoniphilus oxalaticus TaxID=66863 RepID=A0A419SEV3_9BACL|nr:CDP-alcohol phosphatidyltransferase family protein [Ammoniphilus oxalaticus]RKD21842.1 CDP-alcohol phosphatidyltransferase [Ammoniphilus oxalaticus]
MLDTHARKYVEPVISRAASLCIRLGLSANQVTWLGFLIGLTSGLWIYFDHVYWAALFLWISGFLDAVDGSMARLENKSTAWGTVLDITFDRVVELSVVIGLAARYPHAQFMLLLVTATIVISMTVFLTVGAVTEKQGAKSFYYQAGLGERTEGFIMLTVMMLLPNGLLWSSGVFMGIMLVTIGQRLAEARRILKEV